MVPKTVAGVLVGHEVEKSKVTPARFDRLDITVGVQMFSKR
jgi:hypothetical protein